MRQHKGAPHLPWERQPRKPSRKGGERQRQPAHEGRVTRIADKDLEQNGDDGERSHIKKLRAGGPLAHGRRHGAKVRANIDRIRDEEKPDQKKSGGAG